MTCKVLSKPRQANNVRVVDEDEFLDEDENKDAHEDENEDEDEHFALADISSQCGGMRVLINSRAREGGGGG